uniref:Potential DNA-binding domain-containing protein n=1 Tax=Trichuris muris TaxID=70415 RepID=A0A5S6PZA9_TRIMR
MSNPQITPAGRVKSNAAANQAYVFVPVSVRAQRGSLTRPGSDAFRRFSNADVGSTKEETDACGSGRLTSSGRNFTLSVGRLPPVGFAFCKEQSGAAVAPWNACENSTVLESVRPVKMLKSKSFCEELGDGRSLSSAVKCFSSSPVVVAPPKYATGVISNVSSPLVRSARTVGDGRAPQGQNFALPENWHREKNGFLEPLNGCHFAADGANSVVRSESPATPPSELRAVNNHGYCHYVGGKKPCRQRSINGYQFCIRHILMDKTAPYRACAYVRSQNGKEVRCSNAIFQSQQERYCTTHLVQMGLKEPKRRNRKPTNVRHSEPVADAGIRVPYFPELDITKHDSMTVFSGSAARRRDSDPQGAIVDGNGPPTGNGRHMVSPRCNYSMSGLPPNLNGWDMNRAGAEVAADPFPPAKGAFPSDGGSAMVAVPDVIPEASASRVLFPQKSRSLKGVESFPAGVNSLLSTGDRSKPFSNGSDLNPSSPYVGTVQSTPFSSLSSSTSRSPPTDQVIASVWETSPQEQQSPASDAKQKRCIRLKPKRKSLSICGRHRQVPSVNRMCLALDEEEFERSDLFPLGLEPSDSEGEEDEEFVVRKCHGPSSTFFKGEADRFPGCSMEMVESIDLKLYLARKLLNSEAKQWQRNANVTMAILGACSNFPDTTGSVLSEKLERLQRRKEGNENLSSFASSRQRLRCQHVWTKSEEGLAPSACRNDLASDGLSSTDEEGRICGALCLPFVNRCLQHITENGDQHLYNVCNEPACLRHARNDACKAGFHPLCAAHRRDAQLIGTIGTKRKCDQQPAATEKAKKICKHVMCGPSCFDVREALQSAIKEESSQDAQLSFASAVQDLGIEVSEVSEMLSSLPVYPFANLLDTDIVRPDEMNSAVNREGEVVDQALITTSDHNWADVEQFLLSEGYKTNFSVSSSTPNLVNHQQSTEPMWSQCLGEEESCMRNYQQRCAPTAVLDPSCNAYPLCDGVSYVATANNSFDPFLGRLEPTSMQPAVYGSSPEQYYIHSPQISDGGSNHSFLGRFD